MRVRAGTIAAVLGALLAGTLGTLGSAAPAVAAGSPPTLQAAEVGFSPDGDSEQDELSLSYVTQTDGVVALDVYDGVGRSVGTRVISSPLAGQPLRFEEIAAGAGSYSWDGRIGLVTEAGTGGSRLLDGRYLVALVVLRPRDPAVSCALGDTTCFVKDISRPIGTRILRADPTIALDVDGTLYPNQDGYKDSVRLSASFPASAGYTIALTDERDVTLRAWSGRTSTWSTAWNGKDAAGGIVPPGNVTLTATATGAFGNPDAVRSVPVTVAAGRLVHRRLSRTLKPADVLARVVKGDCSNVTSYGSGSWAGGHRYRSMAKTSGCRTGADATDLALGTYAFTLPPATTFGSVKLSAQGRACAGGIRDRAGMFFTNNSAGANLGHEYKQYSTKNVAYSSLGGGRKISWFAGTTRSNCYDVRRFTVTWTSVALVP